MRIQNLISEYKEKHILARYCTNNQEKITGCFDRNITAEDGKVTIKVRECRCHSDNCNSAEDETCNSAEHSKGLVFLVLIALLLTTLAN